MIDLFCSIALIPLHWFHCSFYFIAKPLGSLLTEQWLSDLQIQQQYSLIFLKKPPVFWHSSDHFFFLKHFGGFHPLIGLDSDNIWSFVSLAFYKSYSWYASFPFWALAFKAIMMHNHVSHLAVDYPAKYIIQNSLLIKLSCKRLTGVMIWLLNYITSTAKQIYIYGENIFIHFIPKMK